MKSIGLLVILLGLILGGMYVFHLEQDRSRAGVSANAAEYDEDGMPLHPESRPSANAEDRDNREQIELLACAVCLIGGTVIYNVKRRKRGHGRRS